MKGEIWIGGVRKTRQRGGTKGAWEHNLKLKPVSVSAISYSCWAIVDFLVVCCCGRRDRSWGLKREIHRRTMGSSSGRRGESFITRAALDASKAGAACVAVAVIPSNGIAPRLMFGNRPIDEDRDLDQLEFRPWTSWRSWWCMQDFDWLQ